VDGHGGVGGKKNLILSCKTYFSWKAVWMRGDLGGMPGEEVEKKAFPTTGGKGSLGGEGLEEKGGKKGADYVGPLIPKD